jgi:hypothetical protein
MKNISTIWKLFLDTPPRSEPTDAERAAWLRDPLSHPAIEAMAERELADLPFDRRSFGPVANPRDGACACGARAHS